MSKVILLPKNDPGPSIPRKGRHIEFVAVPIKTEHLQYQRTYQYEVSVGLPNVDEHERELWLPALVRHISRQSIIKAESDQQARSLSQACQLLFLRGPWSETVWSRDASELRPETVLRLFIELENRLDKTKLASTAKYNVSAHFRKYFFAHISSLGAPARLSQLSVGFKTRFTSKGRPRELISDNVVDDRPPLGATPVYEDHRRLRKEILDSAEYVLQKINAAAAKELGCGARLRKALEELHREAIDPDYIAIVGRSTKDRHAKWRYECETNEEFPHSLHQYTAALVQLHDSEQWAYSKSKFGIGFGRDVDKYLCDLAGWSTPMQKVIQLREFLSSQELFACAVVLQITTKWNVASVLDLRQGDVRHTNEGYLIQSYKSKTDDDTPPVLIEGEASDRSLIATMNIEDESETAHDLALQVIQLLLANHDAMVRWKRKATDDSRLFCSAFSRKDGTIQVGYHIEDFRRRYGLPKFSMEQLRTQGMFVEALGENEEAARRKAGHQSIRTTGGYVQQEIAKRLHSSLNFDMQKQIEAEIHILMAGKARRSELKLLRPIGDGASCANPLKPPWREASESGMCPGDRCHVDGGCKNRRLILDEDAIRAAVIAERTYIQNWQALLMQNQHAFAQYHAPSIIFNIALLRMIAASTNAYVLTRIRRQLPK